MTRVSRREFAEAKMNDATKDAAQSVQKDLSAVKNEIAIFPSRSPKRSALSPQPPRARAAAACAELAPM